MKTDRPVYLNLLQISLPLAGQVSFAHRVTGIVLFAGIAFGLYVLDMALASPGGFNEASELMQTGLARFIFLGLLFALVFHIVAGVKHLLLDFHLGDSLEAARLNAVLVIVISVLATAALGVLLW